MDIQFDIDGQGLDQGCTIDFTRESWIQLVACNLHLQLAARVSYSIITDHRRAECCKICVHKRVYINIFLYKWNFYGKYDGFIRCIYFSL